MNYVISIISPKAQPILENIHMSLSLPISVMLMGRGTAVRSMLDLLGIESTEKRVAFTVADREKTQALIREYEKQLFIGAPGHGVVAAVPVKSVGGGQTMAFLGGNEEKRVPELDKKYELVVAIVNEGRTDSVMAAAREAGAGGGTVLHGKGTGSDEKFMNVSIAAEKEILLIIAKREQKADIMRAVLEKAGPDSPAGTVMFSLPVTEVAGFGLKENQ